MNVAFRSTLPVILCASLLLAACSTPAPKKTAERYQPPAGIKVAPPLREKPPAATATPPAATTQSVPAAKPQQPTPTPTPQPTPQPTPKPAAQTTPANQGVAVAKPVPQTAAKTPATRQPAPAKPEPKPVETAPLPEKNASPTKPADSVALAATKTAPVAQEPAAPVTTPASEAIKVSLDNLPLSIHGQWTLDRNESRCVLHSAVQKMEDGQGGTNVQLQLSPTEFTFTTQSDIDLSYSGTGIRIDGGTPFALENVERRTNLAFSRQRSALLGAMKTGQQLELSLGFWPTWPVTQTYSTRFPLQHFASAYTAWETCNKLLSQR